jgi:hypothetical protein
VSNQADAYFVKAHALLTLLELAGAVTVPTGERIDALLTDVQVVIDTGAQPTAATAVAVEKLMTDLGVTGPALADAEKFTAFLTDVKNGQVGIVKGNASIEGVRGAYAFIPAISEQGVSLGLS